MNTKNILLIVFISLFTFNSYAQDEIPTSKIVNIGELDIEVSNYNKVIFKIDSLVTKLNGIIAQQKEANFKAKVTNQIIIRIPTENFSKLVYLISEISQKINTKDIKAIKVDEAIQDLSKRLQSKEEIKARYMELVEKSKISIEIADLETKITMVSKEIHELEKEINNFNESSMSTLNILIVEQAEIVGNIGNVKPSDLSKNAMVEIFRNILLYSLIPVLLILAYYFFVYRPMQKAKRRKRKAQAGYKSPW